MNLFNRLIVILLALKLCVVGAFVFAVGGGLLSGAQLEPYPALSGAAGWVHTLDSVHWLPAGGAAACVLGLLLLALELRDPRSSHELVLREDKFGAVTVSLMGLRRLADYVVKEVPGVEAAACDVRPARDGLRFLCRAVVRPEASAPELAEEIRIRLGAAAAHHLGQPPSRIDVHTQVRAPEPVRQKGKRVR